MSEVALRDNLITLAQTFATARGLSLTTVSKQIHGKHNFLERYAKGEVSPRVDTYFFMIRHLRRNWPPGVSWPELRPINGLGKKVYGP